MRNVFIVTILAGLLGGCSSTRITSDRDSSVDFTQFQTFEYYGWEDESDQILTSLDKDRIEKAFAAEFAKRGLEYVENGGDLVVTLYIVTEQRTSTTAHTDHYGGFGGYYGYGPGWGWGGGHSTTTYSQYNYEVGTLLCSVYDKQNQKLIWEAVATGTVDENPQTREKRIPMVVEKMMDRYPVEAQE